MVSGRAGDPGRSALRRVDWDSGTGIGRARTRLRSTAALYALVPALTWRTVLKHRAKVLYAI